MASLASRRTTLSESRIQSLTHRPLGHANAVIPRAVCSTLRGPPMSASLLCPTCADPIREAHRFCPSCGTSLDVSETPTGTAPRPATPGPRRESEPGRPQSGGSPPPHPRPPPAGPPPPPPALSLPPPP